MNQNQNQKESPEYLLLKNSFNITGLSKNNIRNNNISDINPLKPKKSLRNKFMNLNINEKVDLIRNMINKPPKIKPYDGFAIQGNRCTIESLLQKSFEQEKKAIFEKNKLCKNNYPLIKFLSNRKNLNNTKELMIEILNTEYRELTKAQNNTIKYENYKPKSFQELFKKNMHNNRYLSEIPKLHLSKKKINNMPIKLFDYCHFSNDNEMKETLYLTQRSKKKRFANKRHKGFAMKLHNLVNSNNNRPETQRTYSYLGSGETVRLDNHQACIKNNNILLNRIIRKKYLKLNNDEPDYVVNEIINDISKLKLNNKIMPLNTRVLTI